MAALTAEQRTAAIAEISTVIRNRYVFPDRVPTIVARLDEGLASGRYNVGDPSIFAERVTADLREASGDRHMYLNFAPAQYAAAGKPANDGKDSPELEALWAREARRDYHGLTEMKILPGNIRYLRIAGFQWVNDESGAAYDGAMRFLRGGDAVIIDLRGNGGGSHAAVRYLLSHFMDGDTLDITFLQAGQEPIQSRTLEYLPAGRLKGKPLYVLIDGRVGSGAEAFAYDVQQFRLGTLIGTTTAGAANNNGFSPIAPGFMLSCSFGRPVHPVSKSSWEGTGVPPDVAVDPEQAPDIAQSLALAALAKRADADPADRADWEWARVGIEARLHPVTIPAAKLRAMAGLYGDRRVTWQDGALNFVRRDGKAARLIPLTADGLFAVEGFDDRLRLRLTGDVMEQYLIDQPAPIRLERR
ncbi:S41 family peptidase [Sphingomonas cannabina]|uniref:S41 family peptidase n=1 Tax=Sphingomonas cannabina TaxID=2899123 RepID=UPI001F2E7BF0|nr:S41 family peptidase [Sphingomonas cannabina]UIJ47095.1 S41 family peptidase [Sphingomonas cannabina]